MKHKKLIRIAIFLFLVNYGLLWAFSKPIPYDREIAYWPFAVKYFYYFYLAVSAISVLLVIFWAASSVVALEKINQTILAFLFSLFLIFQCVVVFLGASFGLRFYDHIDSFEFNGTHYYLVVIDQFEVKDIILFGECEQTRYSCKFSPIYFSYTFNKSFVDRSDLELATNRNQIAVTWLGETIFIYDEHNPVCSNTDELYCWETIN